MRHARLIAILLAAPLASCADLTGSCTTDPKPTMRIEVLDAGTGAPLMGSTGAIRDGDYDEELTSMDGSNYLWAGGVSGRAGTYDVTVQREGYATWSREDVRVSANQCGVRTVDLTARLEPVD